MRQTNWEDEYREPSHQQENSCFHEYIGSGRVFTEYHGYDCECLWCQETGNPTLIGWIANRILAGESIERIQESHFSKVEMRKGILQAKDTLKSEIEKKISLLNSLEKEIHQPSKDPWENHLFPWMLIQDP